MFASLLLPLVVAGAVPADSAILAFEPAAPPAAAAVFGDPPVRIDLNERVYRPGDRARVRIRTEEDGHLLVFQVDTDGNLRVLFPLDPFDDSFVRGDRRIELDGRGDRETFIVEANEGQGWIYAAYSRLPFQVERYALGDHWDYRKLSPNRLPESPEPELTDLVRDIARASFDYDIIPYAVSGRQVARTVVRHYDPFYYDCLGCGYYGRYGSSITIRIGAPSRYYYGGCWDAYWCDPYYYDPFYYRPRYVYYGPRYYYRPYYGPPPLLPRHRYIARNRPYYPGFGAGVPYRDRRVDGAPGIRLVSDNTVYGPAPRRAASGFAETPARRQIEESPGYDLNPASPGRRGEVEPSTPSRTDRPSEGRTTTGAPARRPAADGPTTDDRPAAQPRTAEPRTRSAEPSRRGAEPTPRAAEPSPRAAEPAAEAPGRRGAESDRSAEPRSEPSAPRRREPGPWVSGSDAEPEIEARPARPREERPASPSRARSEERAAPANRSAESEREERSERPVQAERPRSADRPSQPAPERRETPMPRFRDGGGERSGGGGGGGSARPAPSSDRGGSAPSAPSGGGRRRAD